jgi:hypothetical protein
MGVGKPPLFYQYMNQRMLRSPTGKEVNLHGILQSSILQLKSYISIYKNSSSHLSEM